MRRMSRKHPRKHLSKKHGRKQRKRRVSKRTRKMRGGYGAGACPFIGPPWNSVTGGNYFKLGTPIGVGGTQPYFGNQAASPQHGGSGGRGCESCGNKQSGYGMSSTYPWIPQPLVNAYRVATGGLGDAALQYQGLAPNPDSRPEIQQQMQT